MGRQWNRCIGVGRKAAAFSSHVLNYSLGPDSIDPWHIEQFWLARAVNTVIKLFSYHSLFNSLFRPAIRCSRVTKFMQLGWNSSLQRRQSHVHAFDLKHHSLSIFDRKQRRLADRWSNRYPATNMIYALCDIWDISISVSHVDYI